MQIISAILQGEVITAGFGKLSLIGSPLRLPQDYLLAVPLEKGTTDRRLAWILTGYRTNLVTCPPKTSPHDKLE